MIPNNFITSANELPGYRIVRNVGIVRGIIVRSRSIVGTIGAGLQSLFGGNITLWTELCELTRREAFELMAQHAQDAGGNAVVGMRYDTTEIAQGVAEVLAYGTAVVVVVAPWRRPACSGTCACGRTGVTEPDAGRSSPGPEHLLAPARGSPPSGSPRAAPS